MLKDNNQEVFTKTSINWYPGHMKKTKDEIKKIMPVIDIVFEIIDARIPLSSKIKDIDDIIRVSHICEGICSCSSSLYKTSENLYYLMFTSKDNCNTEINRLCNIISEYADAVKITPSSASYFQEHYDTIIKEQVFEKLCNI